MTWRADGALCQAWAHLPGGDVVGVLAARGPDGRDEIRVGRIPEEAREKGYVTSLFGRRRYFPGIRDRNFAVRSRAEREAINMPIQGTASDIVKIAMINVYNALRKESLGTRMIMQVHDELLFEAPKGEIEKASAIIKREMESAATLSVPLIAEIGVGDNWMNAK